MYVSKIPDIYLRKWLSICHKMVHNYFLSFHAPPQCISTRKSGLNIPRLFHIPLISFASQGFCFYPPLAVAVFLVASLIGRGRHEKPFPAVICFWSGAGRPRKLPWRWLHRKSGIGNLNRFRRNGRGGSMKCPRFRGCYWRSPFE